MRMTPLQPWIAARTAAAGPPGGDGLDRAALERYQLERLQQTLARARHGSRFYRALLAGAPQVLTGLDEVPRLPFTTAGDLAEQGLQLLAVPQDDIERVVTLDTSGTTGPPKRLYFTRADQELTIDFFRIGMSTFTGPGDRVAILLPCERPGSVGELLARALEQLGAVPLRHSVVRNAHQSLAALHAERATAAVGIPTQLLALARRDTSLRLRSVLLSTDYVPRAVTAAVEAAWGCQVFGHYGMTEMGLGGGVECEARQGYHLREADLYVEIVDPASGEPVPAGAAGEVVFTTLTRTGMPLIRYRTGDLSRLLPDLCPCGARVRRLGPITRRVDGAAPLPGGGAVSMADLDEALFPVAGVLDFDATLSGGPGRARLEVVARVSEDAPSAAAALRAALRRVPAIERARATRGLELALAVQPAGATLAAPAKRRIRDTRKES